MSKFCINCGSEIQDGARACVNCGTLVDGGVVTPTPATTTVNVNAVQQPQQSNGMAVAGFVISLVSVVFCCGSFNWLGLIFSIVGLVKSKSVGGKGKGLAIAGIIISAIVMVLSIILAALGVFTSLIEEINSSSYYY